jgi:uroporphyrinogen-III synthase
MSRSVLITRQASDCVELEALLTRCGIWLQPYPVLALEDVADEPGWVDLIGRLDGGSAPSWTILASPRAPQRFARQCRQRGAEVLLANPIAAIGDGTADSVRAAGLEPTIVGPGTGAGLAAELIGVLDRPTVVVFPCGHHRRPELPDAITNAGHELINLVVYRMRATPADSLPTIPSGLDAVVVTSPRAARLYLDSVGGRPLPCVHWALGPTTRDAAAELGIQCSIPSRPDLKSLAEELCRI